MSRTARGKEGKNSGRAGADFGSFLNVNVGSNQKWTRFTASVTGSSGYGRRIGQVEAEAGSCVRGGVEVFRRRA